MQWYLQWDWLAVKEHTISMQVVHAVVSAVGLVGCEETRVWRLSGGARRKLVLAVALVADPTILLLDEPTT